MFSVIFLLDIMNQILFVPDLSVFKDFIAESEEGQFPECELLEQLKSLVTEAEQCGQVAQQLLAKKHKTRYQDE